MNDMKQQYYDVVIVGCGVGGLYTALHLPSDTRILMLSKEELKTCDSMLAQGGICVLRDEDDYDSYFEDTMRAGHYENRKESVDIMIRGSRDVINTLLSLGVEFEREICAIRRRAHIPNRVFVFMRILPEKRSQQSF